MKILILDDDPVRHKSFTRQFRGHEIVHVYTPFEAADAMAKTKFDLVSLDHDLAFWTAREKVPKEFFGGYADDARMRVELTGFHVAVWMRQMPEEMRPMKVVVHTANAAGAPMMTDLLQQGGFDAVREEFQFTPSEIAAMMAPPFYIFTRLHEVGGSCDNCRPGYPQKCGRCGGALHCGVDKPDATLLYFVCEDCHDRRVETED